MKFQYHFEPHKGWMNDPNGLCCYKGQYHAFFQYNPYAPVWDSMHWGHAVSENLVTWKQVETALIPEEAYENAGGCFSGSAIEKEDMLYLFYTAVSKEYGQAQAAASSSDGIHFVKNADSLLETMDTNRILFLSFFLELKKQSESSHHPFVEITPYYYPKEIEELMVVI